ncbi:hypothetical protein F5884DRAFT_792374 [Xylogone sp. PMI_703]|nr:hypothetical protein F5884DRAFT_792374 [Xylogone sp. PMI_703]
MRRAAQLLTLDARQLRRFHASLRKSASLPSIRTINVNFSDVDVNEFREKAFVPQQPTIITATEEKQSCLSSSNVLWNAIPASCKWFSLETLDNSGSIQQRVVLAKDYLTPFSNTILPYELYLDQNEVSQRVYQNFVGELARSDDYRDRGVANFLSTVIDSSSAAKNFCRFDAPLSLMLQASVSTSSNRIKRLYIAQAQIADLPKQLQADLPTPKLVKETGKGDVYDANIWIGLPPTYTPLHKDPNPNFFVQLASQKIVKIFPPPIGNAIFFGVQREIGGNALAQLRGEEMMEGMERKALDEYVWGDKAPSDGFEVIVKPGDALFIPKGWWHSIKSLGVDLNASVNWWFR